MDGVCCHYAFVIPYGMYLCNVYHQQTQKKWTKCYLRTRLRMERKLLWKKAVVEQVTLVEVQYEYASSTGEDEDSASDVEDLEERYEYFEYD